MKQQIYRIDHTWAGDRAKFMSPVRENAIAEPL